MYVTLGHFRLCRRKAERAAYSVASLSAKGAKPGRAVVCLFGRRQTMQVNSGKRIISCGMPKCKWCLS